MKGIKVVLKHGTAETNLNQGTSYTFTSGPGTFNDFALIFGEKITTPRLMNHFICKNLEHGIIIIIFMLISPDDISRQKWKSDNI